MALPMDGVTLPSSMPPRAPLDMVRQDFRRSPAVVQRARRASRSDILARLAVFGPALGLTVSLIVAIQRWLASGGMTGLEAALIVLVAVTFIWVSLSVSTVLVALMRLPGPLRSPMAPRGPAQEVALLVPVCDEVPEDVFGNAAAMLHDLARLKGPDRFSLFILSDTRDEAVALREEQAYAMLRASAPADIPVYYRRRATNTDRKVGNISDWIVGWGAAFEAMLILDADSLMSGQAIRRLADQLSRDPTAGLIQTFPLLIGAETLFGRLQQFSSGVYGWLLAEGLALWSQSEGNYWGHNAIIRTRAFAESAGLPHLRGGRLILSHDFVEAGLLRRAGWSVRFLPRLKGSFEETPATLVDYVLRDRRWCRGNLQHLRLLAARGFHPVSRFHLLQGAVAFLLSPAWFALLVVWAVLGQMPAETVVYFNASNPLYPVWPYMSRIEGGLFLAFIYTMLLFPKLTGALIIGRSPATRAMYGGSRRFWSTTATEIALSVAYAPVLMVQQTLAVCFAVVGRGPVWAPQSRQGSAQGWLALLRFHWVETVLGVGLMAALLSGNLSWWLSPVALSLVLAVPLSKLSAVNVARPAFGALRLDSPLSLREPDVVQRARAERAQMRLRLNGGDVKTPVAAE